MDEQKRQIIGKSFARKPSQQQTREIRCSSNNSISFPHSF